MVVEEEIGKRIKKIRLSKKLTLQDVANKTGLSSGYLSKLEKSKKSPPISTLISIAAAFDVTVSVSLVYAFKGRLMEPYILRVPKGDIRPHFFQHEGQEMLYVIKGSGLFHYGEKEFSVEPGDSIYFDASVPHLGESNTDEDLVMLMVTVNPGKNQLT